MSSFAGIKMLFTNVQSVVNLIAFQPPKKHLYTINDSNQEKLPAVKNSITKSRNCPTETYEIDFTHSLHSIKFFKQYHWLHYKAYAIKKPTKKSSVVVLFIKNTSLKEDEHFTILYSHGNAATLGTIFPYLYDIATQLKCNVVGYDYNGYGESKGKPSEKHINANIEDVFNFMQSSLGIMPEKIIVYGHSIGTVPSIDLSSKNNVGGLILECPLASGKLLVNPDYELKEENSLNDSFCSWGKVININCPTFLIHGMLDNVIPSEHSLLLSDKIIHLIKWFPKKCGHTNLYEKYRSKFILKVHKFFDFIKSDQKKQSQKQNSKEKNFMPKESH